MSSGVSASVGSALLGFLSWILLALGALILTLCLLRYAGIQDAPAKWQDLAGGSASVAFGMAARILARRFAAI